MKKFKLLIEVEYDDEMMHGDDEQSLAWFRNQVLLNPGVGGELVLHSNEIGDSIGIAKVIEFVEG